MFTRCSLNESVSYFTFGNKLEATLSLKHCLVLEQQEINIANHVTITNTSFFVTQLGNTVLTHSLTDAN